MWSFSELFSPLKNIFKLLTDINDRNNELPETKTGSHLSKQWPVTESQVRGHVQGLQPPSPKPQCPDRQWLQLVPPTPGLQRHCPLLGWHQTASLWVLTATEPAGSHQQPAQLNIAYFQYNLIIRAVVYHQLNKCPVKMFKHTDADLTGVRLSILSKI